MDPTTVAAASMRRPAQPVDGGGRKTAGLHFVFASAFRYPDGGPGATRSLAVASGLIELGHAVTVVVIGRGGRDAGTGPRGIDWVDASGAGPRRGPVGWRRRLGRSFAAALAAVHRKAPVDAVFIVNRDWWILNRCRVAAAQLGLPAFHELTEFLDDAATSRLRNAIQSRLLLRELRRLPGTLVISTALEDFLTHRGIARVALTGPCVDADGWDVGQPPLPSGTLRVGYAGSLHQGKDGVLDLLEVVARTRVRRPELDLRLEVVGGEPKELRRARARAGDLRIENVVRFHGRVPGGSVADILAPCHVLVLPRPASRQAEGGFPTKLGEYLATGRPVVATAVGDLPRYLDAGENCYLVPPGDQQALSDALVSIAEDYGRALSIGRAGQRLTATSFHPRRTAGVVARFAGQLLAWPADQDRSSPDSRDGADRLVRPVTRPIIAQHSFGRPGTGGPITALGRVLESPLAQTYTFVRLHQDTSNGFIDHRRIVRWTRFLRSLRPDLVHVRGLGNEGFHAVLAARLARCPRVLVSVHGTARDLAGPGRRGRRWLLVHLAEPLTLLMASHLATVCQYAARRRFLRLHRSKFVGVVPNGVPLLPPAHGERERTRSALGYSSDDLVAIVVGRLSLEKGHAVLAAALRQDPATAAGLRLLLVGDGPDAAEIRQLYDDVPQLDVQYLGLRHDVEDLLRASDLFVFPTLHENLSNALLEAMSAGLPIVATAVGGNVEVLASGGGALVPPADPDALGAALRRLMASPDERATLGRTARSTVERGYSSEQMIRGWQQVYATMLTEEP